MTGDCLTDHGHSQKWTMYDEITRVPLSCVTFSLSGKKNRRSCPAYGLGSCDLEMAGEHPETMEAQSILPALEEDVVDGSRIAYAEQAKDLILPTPSS